MHDITLGNILKKGLTEPGESDKAREAKEYYKKQKQAKKAEEQAMKVATGEHLPNRGRPKSVVNRATEYGALFNKMNEDRATHGLGPLKTAMEVLIEAMQSKELELKDKSKIALMLAPFESSRAPIISIEHVQNVTKDEEASADDSLDDFLQSIRKI
jgi:hypothetical protein